MEQEQINFKNMHEMNIKRKWYYLFVKGQEFKELTEDVENTDVIIDNKSWISDACEYEFTQLLHFRNLGTSVLYNKHIPVRYCYVGGGIKEPQVRIILFGEEFNRKKADEIICKTLEKRVEEYETNYGEIK